MMEKQHPMMTNDQLHRSHNKNSSSMSTSCCDYDHNDNDETTMILETSMSLFQMLSLTHNNNNNTSSSKNENHQQHEQQQQQEEEETKNMSIESHDEIQEHNDINVSSCTTTTNTNTTINANSNSKTSSCSSFGVIERSYLEHYQQDIQQIIEDNKDFLTKHNNYYLSSIGVDTSIDDRILILYNRIQEEGVNDLLLRLGVIDNNEEKIDSSSICKNNNNKICNDSLDDRCNNDSTVSHISSDLLSLSNNNHNHNDQQQNDTTQDEYNHMDSNNDTTISSIELVRKYNNKEQSIVDESFQSPCPTMNVLNQSYESKKRLATTSGKRGMDLHRMRMNDDTNNRSHNQNDNFHFEDSLIYQNDSGNHCNDHDDDGFDFTDDYDQFKGKVDGIMNATTHFDPMDDSSINNGNVGHHRHSQMSFLDEALKSQSPILRKSPAGTRRNVSGDIDDDDSTCCGVESDVVSNNNDQQDFSIMNDSIESVNSSFNHNCHKSHEFPLPKQHEKRNDFIHNDDIDCDDENHVDVTLRQDSNFYLDPLQVYRPPRWAASHYARNKLRTKENNDPNKRMSVDINVHHLRKNRATESKAVPTCTFVDDPFRDFGSRAADRLEVVYDWLLERDMNEHFDQSSANAVLLSIPLEQVMRLALLTLLRNCVHEIPRQHRPLEPNKNNSNDIEMMGGTLIVVKTKDDVNGWLSTLREKSSFSVLNHAEIPSTERRMVTIMSKCCGYDIVLTTYDSLKTKEVTLNLDDSGRIAKSTNSHGGWMTTKTASSGKESDRSSKVLSRLHHIEWTRIIFVDTLGTSSYLTKPGTARLEAATALKANARYVITVCEVSHIF